MLSLYGLCKLAGTGEIVAKLVSDVKKLAKLVSLDFLYSFGKPIASCRILQIIIAVLVQNIVNYSQKDSIISFNCVLDYFI